jgi:hypothetical protein
MAILFACYAMCRSVSVSLILRGRLPDRVANSLQTLGFSVRPTLANLATLLLFATALFVGWPGLAL